MYIFFFKQKTAYEMRISDWSSDVCSSDLTAAAGHVQHVALAEKLLGALLAEDGAAVDPRGDLKADARREVRLDRAGDDVDRGALRRHDEVRSEEHTSELQSLMRITYAVFCLKKKKQTRIEEKLTKHN